MKVAIVNYGMGNLASVRRAFEDIGADAYIANHPDDLDKADRVVLPGVGAFAEGMRYLREGGWVEVLQDVVIRQRRPMMGICLGMQMLASVGHEGGLTGGLGFIPGEIKRLDMLGCKLRIPHVGWNEVEYKTSDALFREIPDLSDFYFVHSFVFESENDKHLMATTRYGCTFAAVVKKDNVYGCQFHPEKSSKAGRQLLKNFMVCAPC
ncbi:MAG: imidazole glycerol phosphate synthase subunit HisH [Gallionella sp.]